MPQHFTHLHVHTDHSLLDGAITLEKLINFSKTNNFKAAAISDHGNIFGAVKFFQQAHKAGIKPVLGMEAYLTDDVRIKKADNKYYHLIIIVENQVGYKNLCKLISYAYTDGFYFKPRIDYQMLERHAEGLIVTSACLGGHIPTLLMNNQYDEARTLLNWYQRTFKDRFYLEVQPPDQKDQIILNEKIFELGSRHSIPIVATGDCHYTTAQDREAHEIMLAIQTQHKLTDPKRFTFGDCRVHLRTQDEMLSIFKDNPETLWSTGEIADRCSFNFETGKLFFPQYEIPAPETQETYFKRLCVEGLEELAAHNRFDLSLKEQYAERLHLEIELISKMGFITYFLVVSDFICWAKNNHIPVGPGRGSAAGSLVAWALKITDIDPIRYNLLFERFLNPERVSMPDIDIDFCIEGRDKVINYVKDRYGHDKVCQIITFGTMMAKGVLKDVARVLGFPFEDSNTLTNLIPDQLKITLTESLEQEPKLKTMIEDNPQVAKLFDIALRLEGLTRHASKHAAGIVISPLPINEVLPVYVPPKTNDLVTQYAMTELESLGFLKMDFLGLKNLTLIDRTINLIEKIQGKKIILTHLPLDDKPTFALLARGCTSGVFQLESDGIKDVLIKLQPEKFEDIIAVNALYRPGPLGSGMVNDFIERKHGRQKIEYFFPELAEVLQETYGVIVYQEQVMKIASAIAGFSLGESDILRRAMGKKKADEMAKQKSIFVERAIARKYDEKKAGDLFDLMAYFAGYGFNKSHSAAYALIAYQTAYLKANYPAEFMACLISLEAHDAEKMAFYIDEAKSLNLRILMPDINTSDTHFSVVEGAIRCGLQGIKNVGLAALENILEERSQKGPFIDLLDLCMRIDLRTVNKRILESLIYAGALDTLPGNRAQKYEELHTIMERAAQKKAAALTGQLGLFDIAQTQSADLPHQPHIFQARSEWSDAEKLEKEKEMLGIYLSGKPLDSYIPQIRALQALAFSQATQHTGTIICCGLIQSQKVIATKKGDKMAFLHLEDEKSKAEVVIFPQLYKKIDQWLNDYTLFVIKGTVDRESTQIVKIKAQECIPLDLIFAQGYNVSTLTLNFENNINEQLLTSLKENCINGTIPLHITLTEQNKKFKLATRTKIAFTPDFFQLLSKNNVAYTISLL